MIPVIACRGFAFASPSRRSGSQEHLIVEDHSSLFVIPICYCAYILAVLAHSASFESCDKNAPSKLGTKHLVLSAYFGVKQYP